MWEIKDLDTNEVVYQEEYRSTCRTCFVATHSTSGDQYWYKEGKYHRLDGPAITYADGSESWFKEGRQHRLAGPAIIYSDGDSQWWVDGKLHRTDGPAIITADGLAHWYIGGVRVSPPPLVGP